jgi:hypothetical protein
MHLEGFPMRGQGRASRTTLVPMVLHFMDPSPIEVTVFCGEMRVFMKTIKKPASKVAGLKRLVFEAIVNPINFA